MNTVFAAALILAMSGAWDAASGGHAARRHPVAFEGMFLVAARNMPDPRFQKAVILIADHGGHGVMGLIINRPTALELKKVFPDFKDNPGIDGTLHYGGPVSRFMFTMLIRAGTNPPPENATRVFAGVYLSMDLQTLFNLPAAKSVYARGFLGYAGWGPGQLENELERGDWILAPAKAEMLFRPGGEDVWNELIEAYEGSRWIRAPSPGFSPGAVAARQYLRHGIDRIMCRKGGRPC